MPLAALNPSASYPGVIVVPSSALNDFARAMTSCGSEMSAGVLVHHICGCVAEHSLSSDTEDLNDPLLVGGDTRKVGAVENRVLQGSRFLQRLFRLFARGIVCADQQIADNGDQRGF